MAWVVLFAHWFWNVFLRKGQVFYTDEIPTGGRISAPSRLQKSITQLPLVNLLACILLVAAVGKYDHWKDCDAVLSSFVMLGSVMGEGVLHAIFLKVACAWCILENEITPRQQQRFSMLLALLVISTAGYHCGVPFLFTTLVMVYCTILTLEFHSIVLHIRKLRAALEEQIAAARSRREANDVASALIEQMKVQLKMLVSFQHMLVAYLTAQILINGPLYMFVGRQVAVCLARHVMDLAIFGYFILGFSECHVNAFPYVALVPAGMDSGLGRRAARLDPPEVWTYFSLDLEQDVDQLTRGDLILGIPTPRPEGEEGGYPIRLVFNPSSVQYEFTERQLGASSSGGSEDNV